MKCPCDTCVHVLECYGNPDCIEYHEYSLACDAEQEQARYEAEAEAEAQAAYEAETAAMAEMYDEGGPY